jgi:hypothetical protein
MERAFFKSRLSSPMRVQEFLDEIPYNLEEDGETLRSPRRVIADRTANCIEGAILAAAALRELGHPPLIMDLIAVNDEDHVIAPFRRSGLWGAIGTSKYTGLRYREPVYSGWRELVMSYFEAYFNPDGERTMRGYGRPVNLRRFDRINWTTSDDDLWPIAHHLEGIPHRPILPPGAPRGLTLVDARTKAAHELFYPRRRP